MKLTPFHLAIPVKEITTTRDFYRDVLGCKEGRSSDHWVDFDFFGHQLVIHVTEEAQKAAVNAVDGKAVSCSTFWGCIRMGCFSRFRKSGKRKRRGIYYRAVYTI